MITTEGMNYLLSAGLKSGAQIGDWYVFPFKANYTPTAGDTAAVTVPLLTESTAYEGTTRAGVALGAVANGSVDNSASVVSLTATVEETWYGAALISTGTRGQAAGVLMKVEKFAAPILMTVGSRLELLVDIDLLQPA